MINSRFAARSVQYISFFAILIVGFPISSFIGQIMFDQPMFQPFDAKSETTWLILIGLWFVFTLMDMEHGYTAIRTHRQHTFRLLRINCLALAVFDGIFFRMTDLEEGRLLAFLYAIVVFLLMLGSSTLVRALFRRFAPTERKLLIMSHFDAELIHRLRVDKDFYHHNIDGIVMEDCTVQVESVIPVLGNFNQLSQILRERAVDAILLVVDWHRSDLDTIMRTCQQSGVNVELLFLSPNALTSTGRVIQLNDRIILRIESTQDDPLGHFLKRITDVVVSLVLLLILSPLFCAIAIRIKAGSDGPIFFLQQRVGLRGRKFTCFKFRTMVVDAEKRKYEILHLNEMSGPVFKMKHDPRVTPFGVWLRHTSLDELPQLINVVSGHMSLVGPRPPLPSEVQNYDEWQQRRLSVRPGITGLWQISGRNEIDFEQWMRMDLEYIDNWSFGRDLFILLKTIPAVLNRKGAY